MINSQYHLAVAGGSTSPITPPWHRTEALSVCACHVITHVSLISFLILIMWNNTDTPLAYFISFRTCGTWLHGDKRGSIDRFHNQYRSPYIAPNEKWHRYNAETKETSAHYERETA